MLPDIVVDGASHGPLVVRAASVRGDAHRYGKEPRQDALCVTRLGGEEDGLLLLAVADGVGSARRSHLGSNEACRRIAHMLQRCAEDLQWALRDRDEMRFAALVNSAVGSTAEVLAQMAARRGHPPEEYATTLRALLVPLDSAVRNRGFFAVGDGGVARLRRGVWNADLFDEQGGGTGVIDTRTAALPSRRYAETRIFDSSVPGDVLVLCTDGLSTPLAGDAEMREFLSDAWGTGTTPEPADFLWQLQFRVKSYDDDRTAICLWDGTA
ncbi:protein phosphatase 2C domain-containing protein [Actinacidiphila glaucinigra]|uniref:protein phosphatase 2C domain-containing protein n=1 Tax=Actinacidiphila glaucinigra TaxID=235986 RepID=UPI003830C0C9